MSRSHIAVLILCSSYNPFHSFISLLNENFLSSSSSPHSLNFIHPILVLVVTEASLPPMAFNLSPKYLVPQFLPLYEHIFFKQNLLPEFSHPLSFCLSTMYPFTTLCSHHRICHHPLAACGTWINFTLDYLTFRTTHYYFGFLEVHLQLFAFKRFFPF